MLRRLRDLSKTQEPLNEDHVLSSILGTPTDLDIVMNIG